MVMAEPKIDPVVAYGREIKQFTDAMQYKLRVNAHKGKWEGLSAFHAIRLLEREVEELHRAIASGNSVDVMMECADIANFAMMITNIVLHPKSVQPDVSDNVSASPGGPVETLKTYAAVVAPNGAKDASSAPSGSATMYKEERDD